MNIASLIRIRLERLKAKNYAPIHPRHDDVYLVEYPKSGVTWLSTIIGNFVLLQSGRNEKATFVSARQYIPDIHISRDIGDLPYSDPPVRFIKSHAKFNSYYKNVVYLVRNPIDVMNSYYRYHSEGGRCKMSLVEFCKESQWGISAWKNHVRDWCFTRPDKTGFSPAFIKIRYEDLVRDTDETLRGIWSVYGWQMNDKHLETAIANSSADKMKENESEYARMSSSYCRNFVKGERLPMPKELVKDIVLECRTEMKAFGYSIDASDYYEN